MTHVWNERYQALYDRTYRVLCDAGVNEKLADELATQRALAAALEITRATECSFVSSCCKVVAMVRPTEGCRSRKLLIGMAVPRGVRHRNLINGLQKSGTLSSSEGS